LPVPVPVANTNLVVYDLPGLLDSRGVPYDVLTAAFLKNITENARNVRFVFVESMDSLTTARGRLFKELLNKARNVFDVNVSNSIFVVTKTPHAMSDHKKTQINSLMHDMFDDQFVRDNGNHFVERKKGIDPAEKEHIIQAICQLKGTQYNKANRPLGVGALYDADAQSRLQLIFDDVKTRAFHVLKDNPEFRYSKDASDYIKKELESIGNAHPKMFNDFQKKINDSLEVQLLKNLARIDIEQWFAEARGKIQARKQDADKAYKLLKNAEDAEDKRHEAQQAREAAEKKLEDPHNWPQTTVYDEPTNIYPLRNTNPRWVQAEQTRAPSTFRRSRWHQEAVCDVVQDTNVKVRTIAKHPDTGEERVLEERNEPGPSRVIDRKKIRSRSCSKGSKYAANSTHGL
jgi:hypothetical protein